MSNTVRCLLLTRPIHFSPVSTMHPSVHFHYCPCCGAARESSALPQVFCSACGFTFFVSVTCGCAAFLERPDGKVLFIRRAKEPSKGMLSIPGGFVDVNESAEDGLRREFREEVGFEPMQLEFLCTHPNSYHYKGITYPVIDIFFKARGSGEEHAQALDAVDEVSWLNPSSVNPGDLAFPSLRHAFQLYLRARRH